MLPCRGSNEDEPQDIRIIGRCGATPRKPQGPSRDAQTLVATPKLATSWVLINGEETKSIANFYNQQLASVHVFFRKAKRPGWTWCMDFIPQLLNSFWWIANSPASLRGNNESSAQISLARGDNFELRIISTGMQTLSDIFYSSKLLKKLYK